MARALNGRAVTREDLSELKSDLNANRKEGMDSLAALIRGEVARVSDKIGTVQTILTDHIREEEIVQRGFLADIESLKKYRWTVVGAFGAVVVIIKIAMNALFKI
jgi:hypothetical protein